MRAEPSGQGSESLAIITPLLVGESELRIRSEIQFDGTGLRDPRTGNVHKLSELARETMRFHRGDATIETAVDRVEHLRSVSRAELEREVRQMLLLGMFDGTCATFRERLVRVRVEPPTVRALPGSRFSCQHSGACCRGYLFGPISAAEKERIERLRPVERMPQIERKPLFAEYGTASGARAHRLAIEGDTCVFFEPGAGCGLHRHFGERAKPALCQLFPLAIVATIDGIRVYDTGHCATFATSATAGAELEDDLPRIIELAEHEIYHPAVWIHGMWRCDYGLVLRLSDRLVTEAQARQPLPALYAIGHIARRFISALVRCPLESGQPEAACAAALSASADACRPPQLELMANARVGMEKLAVLAVALMDRVAVGEWLTPSFLAATNVLNEVCQSPGRETMSATARAALAVSMPSRTDEVLTLSLRNRLYGRELLLDERLEPGLLRIALTLILTLAGARCLAADQERRQASIAQLSLAHMVATRTLHRPQPHALLRANGGQVWPILDALPLLAAMLG